MPSKRKSFSATSAEEVVRGTATRRRHVVPRCVVLPRGKDERGLLDLYAGGRLSVPIYTDHVANLLRRVFVDDRQVVVEWRAMLGETLRSPRTGRQILYSPEVDIAVGPFATFRSYEEVYDRLAELHSELLAAMRRAFQMNLRNFGSSFTAPRLGSMCSHNLNARCFMALEVEKGNTDVKYLMGSMMNAASLGRVGVVVAWEWPRMGDLLRARESMALWDEAGKNTLNTGNLLFLTRDQLLRILRRRAVVIESPPWASDQLPNGSTPNRRPHRRR